MTTTKNKELQAQPEDSSRKISRELKSVHDAISEVKMAEKDHKLAVLWEANVIGGNDVMNWPNMKMNWRQKT